MAIFIAAIAVVYFNWNGKNKLGQITDNLDLSSPESSIKEGNSAAESGDVFAEPVVYGSLKESYSGQNFSFKYPEGFRAVSALMDESREVVTVENEKGGGFQIFTMVWDESEPITPERIWEDVPDAEINDPRNAELDGIKVLVFNGHDEDVGETFEVWAVNKAKLYQIAGPKTAEKLVIETLETWEWK